ncbi:serine hydrolase domain-containing protein [Lewinella sp. IMCC34191]|uniref:serine hydrolase domain-containing protein n=1 Tax=Lewinella sp. IMCC34191 TaxID=2259172 RepID=UPI000E23CCB9|nr:serine hydrolase domain-containing protein [Lewinella sp. IMCC34191]
MTDRPPATAPFVLAVLRVVIVWLAISPWLSAQDGPVTMPDGRQIVARTLDSLVNQAATAAGVPGLSLAIVNSSGTMYHRTYGVTNTEARSPVTDSTIFEAASLSKPLFAYLALKMEAQGLFDLDRPLAEYLPHPGVVESDREANETITARQVLAHATGFPNHANGDSIRLAHPPGRGFSYSGEAYQYLAAVIAYLSNTDCKGGLDSLYREMVGDELGMPRSGYVRTPDLAAHRATGHDERGKPTDEEIGTSFHAYSSLQTEAAEYGHFLSALLRKKGLPAESFRDMLAEQNALPADHELRKEIGQTGWGLGMARKPSPYGAMHMHTGNNHDFQSYLMLLPERDFGIVFFMNAPLAIPFIRHLSGSVGPLF